MILRSVAQRLLRYVSLLVTLKRQQWRYEQILKPLLVRREMVI